MRGISERAQAIREQLRRRRARLPWAELEAEARRQGCAPAAIFFDRAGRPPELDRIAPATLIAGDETKPDNRDRRTPSPF